MNNNLVDTLLDLVHETGYIAVKEAMETSVLERVDSTDPRVFMLKLLKTYTLDDIVYNNARREDSKRFTTVEEGFGDDRAFKIVKIDNFYYKIIGHEDSYSDTNWKTWSVVTPKQKTITIYE